MMHVHRLHSPGNQQDRVHYLRFESSISLQFRQRTTHAWHRENWKDLPSSIDIPSEPIIVSLTLLKPLYFTGDFSGDENIPSISSIPCSSRLPSFSVMPVRLDSAGRLAWNTSQEHGFDILKPSRASNGYCILTSLPFRRWNSHSRELWRALAEPSSQETLRYGCDGAGNAAPEDQLNADSGGRCALSESVSARADQPSSSGGGRTVAESMTGAVRRGSSTRSNEHLQKSPTRAGGRCARPERARRVLASDTRPGGVPRARHRMYILFHVDDSSFSGLQSPRPWKTCSRSPSMSPRRPLQVICSSHPR